MNFTRGEVQADLIAMQAEEKKKSSAKATSQQRSIERGPSMSGEVTAQSPVVSALGPAKDRIMAKLRLPGNEALLDALRGDGRVWLSDKDKRDKVRAFLAAFGAEALAQGLTPQVEKAIRKVLDLPSNEPLLERHLTSITQFRSGPIFGDGDLACLPRCTGLTELSLDGTQVTDAGLKSLEGMTGLTRLSLGITQVTDAGMKSLERLTGMTQLDLSRTQVTDAGMKSLERLTGMTQLDLSGTQVTDAGLKSLEGLTGLATLKLGGTQVTDAGLQHLIGLKALTALSLISTRVSNKGLQLLSRITGLKRLDLEDTDVSDEGLDHLERLQLNYLNLGRLGITDVGLTSLESMKSLTILGLEKDRNVTDRGLLPLANLSALTKLYLTDTTVTDAGLKSLKGLTGLTDLELHGTQVTKGGVAKLKKALPNCVIYGP